MKKIQWLFSSLILMSFVFSMSSCAEDDLGGGTDPNPIGPSISITAQPATVVTDLGSDITVSVSATKGDNQIRSITVLENGAVLDGSRVQLVNGISANPLVAAGNDKDALTWDIAITTNTQCGSYTYSMRVEDDNGLTDETSFVVDLESEVGPTVAFNVTPPVGVGSLGQIIEVNLNAVKGDLPLNNVTIWEDGVLVDASRVDFNGNFANPIDVTGADVDGFNWIVNLAAHSEEGTKPYTVQLEDDCSMVSAADFNLTVSLSTSISNTLTGVLFNQAGPVGKGALDLDTGYSSGVTSPDTTTNTFPIDAEIRDMGINSALPNTSNWREQIGPMVDNGVEMKRVDLTAQVENFSFDNVATVEEIIGTFETGFTLTEMVGGNPASSAVLANDLFVVKRDSKYYLIRVDEVNKTTTNNDDNYVLSIKY